VKRGDIVLVVVRGDYGKPRPAVIVQSDLYNATHASLLVCLLTTEVVEAPLFRLSKSLPYHATVSAISSAPLTTPRSSHSTAA